MQTGKMVLVEELIHRLGRLSQPLSVLVFVETSTEVKAIQQLDYRTSGSVEAIYLPVADPSPESLGPVLDRLDTVITFSRDLGKARLYPAIDPLRSTSRLLDPAIVGEDHVRIAEDARALLGSDRDPDRATRLRHYLSQPFYVAEAFTNRAGTSVPLSTTLADCRAILDGTQDNLDPETLYMTGSLGEAVGGN
jgi:F-type H+-transporting ATPase subunit beta